MRKINPLTAAVVGGVVGAAGAAAAAKLMDKRSRNELGKNVKDVIQQGSEVVGSFNKGTQTRKQTHRTNAQSKKA